MNKWHVDYEDTKKKDREWREVRQRVLKRDRYRCRVFDCTVKGAKNLTVHHVVPRDEGGDNRDANLITLCPKHHDEVEIARLRNVLLIEAWDSYDQKRNGIEYVTSTILSNNGAWARGDADKPVENDGKKQPAPKRKRYHRCADSTVQAIDEMLVGSNLPEVTKRLGYSPQFASTLSAIVNRKPGAISAKREDELRARLGLSKIAPVEVERSSKVPEPKEPLPVVKQSRPMRKRPSREKETSLVTYTPQFDALQQVVYEIDEDHVLWGDNNEWEYAPRGDTTIGVRIQDADWFDALARYTALSKTDLFSEILTFYIKAHCIEFVEMTSEDKQGWLRMFKHLSPGDTSRVDVGARGVSLIVSDYCKEKGVDVLAASGDFIAALIEDIEFHQYVSQWIKKWKS